MKRIKGEHYGSLVKKKTKTWLNPVGGVGEGGQEVISSVCTNISPAARRLTTRQGRPKKPS